MKRNKMALCALITSLVALSSFTIALIIAVSTGAYGAILAGTYRFPAKAAKYHYVVDQRKTISDGSIKAVSVRTSSDRIVLREGEGNNIAVWYHGEIDALRPLDVPQLTVEQQGSTLAVGLKYPPTMSMTYDSVVLEVVLPKGYTGDVSAASASGDITVGSHRYAALQLNSESGDVTLQPLQAQQCSVKSSSGDVRTQSITAESTEFTSSSGDITALVSGTAQVRAASGNIHLTAANSLTGLTVESSSGDVTLIIPAHADLAIDAHTSSGRITSKFPLTLTGNDKNTLTAQTGHATHTVSITTASGDVTFEQGD